MKMDFYNQDGTVDEIEIGPRALPNWRRAVLPKITPHLGEPSDTPIEINAQYRNYELRRLINGKLAYRELSNGAH